MNKLTTVNGPRETEEAERPLAETIMNKLTTMKGANETYSAIRVYRNSALVATIGGSCVSSVDRSVLGGNYSYDVECACGSESESCSPSPFSTLPPG